MKKGTRKHKLMTKEIEAKFAKIPWGSTDGKAAEAKVVVKFFSPYSNWTWYAVEGRREGNDWVFFGLVDGHEKELGYFCLSELENAYRGPLPLVERDCYFGDHVLGEYLP